MPLPPTHRSIRRDSRLACVQVHIEQLRLHSETHTLIQAELMQQLQFLQQQIAALQTARTVAKQAGVASGASANLHDAKMKEMYDRRAASPRAPTSAPAAPSSLRPAPPRLRSPHAAPAAPHTTPSP